MNEVNGGGRSSTFPAAARLSLSLLIKPEGIAAIWPPAGTPLLVSLVYAIAFAGAAVVNAWLLLHFVSKQIGFTRAREVVGFLVLAVILSSGLLSLAAAASDGMGKSPHHSWVLGWVAQFVPLAALNLLAFGYMAESSVFPLLLPYLTLPFLLWAAVRFGVRGVASASLAIMAIPSLFLSAAISERSRSRCEMTEYMPRAEGAILELAREMLEQLGYTANVITHREVLDG